MHFLKELISLARIYLRDVELKTELLYIVIITAISLIILGNYIASSNGTFGFFYGTLVNVVVNILFLYAIKQKLIKHTVAELREKITIADQITIQLRDKDGNIILERTYRG